MGTEASGDGTGHDSDAKWYTVAAAARQLGITPRAVRARIRRGTVEWRQAGNTGREVMVASGDGSLHASGHVAEDDAAELAVLREELADALVRAAVAEARADGLRELVDREREIARELRIELVGARQPWWRKWWST